MKNRSLLLLVCCIFIGGFWVSANGSNKDYRDLVKSKGDSLFHQPSFDYHQRQINIRSHILKMFPGTYLDSMNVVINLLSDSIRNELLKTKAKDSLEYLKACLSNVLKDSALLDRLGKISIEQDSSKLNFNEVLTAHCMDASNSLAVDSVTMDVFSGSSLLASAIADNLGIIRLNSILQGDYSIVFSRRGYVPVSLIHFKVNTTKQACIEITLQKQSGYFIKVISQNIWISFATGVIILLFLISFLAYFIAKRVNKKNTK